MILPTKSTLYKNIMRSQDPRGEILSIVDESVKNVSIINCNPKSIRSNHYHLTDWHFMYVLEGEIDYFFSDIDKSSIKYLKVRQGETIYTPPMELHATYFPIYTSLIVSSLNSRDQETYEKDTVRIELININNVLSMIEKFS